MAWFILREARGSERTFLGVAKDRDPPSLFCWVSQQAEALRLYDEQSASRFLAALKFKPAPDTVLCPPEEGTSYSIYWSPMAPQKGARWRP